MTRQIGALSGAVVVTLGLGLLGGPVQAVESTEPVGVAEILATAERAVAAQAGDWAVEGEAPVTAASQAAAGDVFFTDSRTNEHVEAIRWMQQAGIATGWSWVDGSSYYQPWAPVDRDAMAAFLYRVAGSPEYTAPAVSPFPDVARTQKFYKEIAWLAEEGITRGWADGSFRPWHPVNRDAMAAFLYRMADSPDYTAPAVSPFRDVTVGQEHYAEIAWLAHKQISTGWADRTYRPLQPVNRDAMAAFLYRYANPDWRPPVATVLKEVPTVRNEGFEHRSASIDGTGYEALAVREFSVHEQAVLDFDTASVYDRIETVIGIEDGHQDPGAVYRVVVYYEDRIRKTLDIRPGEPVVYDDIAVDQDRVRLEVTKVAGDGTSALVLGGARMLSEVTPTLLSPEHRVGRTQEYLLSHFDVQSDEPFDRRPETGNGAFFQSSLSYAGIGETPQLLEHPLRGTEGFFAQYFVSDRTVDPDTQYRVRILADGVARRGIIVGAGKWDGLYVEPAERIEVTRIAGEGEAWFFLGNARFLSEVWPYGSGS